MDFQAAADLFMLTLTLYREARGEGTLGMIAVGCVIRNRVERNRSSYYAECTKPLQFSSITAKADSQLTLYPPTLDAYAKIAQGIIDGSLIDSTHGSTLYYAPDSIITGQTILVDNKPIPFPKIWNKGRVEIEGFVGRHLFLREV